MAVPMRAGLTRLPQELLLLTSRSSFLRRSSLLTLRKSTPRPSLQPILRSFHQSVIRREESHTDDHQTAPDGAKPATKFEELGQNGVVHPHLIDTITKTMGLDTMTTVQSMTIHEALKGIDIVAQAKTGTGKTLGFLLPTLQNVLEKNPELVKNRRPRYPRPDRKIPEIRAVIISPTRELAEQIAVVARTLVKGTDIRVQTAVGGTRKADHLRAIRQEGCHVLVATPGRLKDVLSDEYDGIEAPNVHTLVLDEADRLLDAGFLPDIQEIEQYFPDKASRQTLMYSATIPREVISLARNTMRPDLHIVRTVQDNEVPTQERVRQHVVHTEGMENIMPALLELLRREHAASNADPERRPFKAIVYFGSTAEVTWATELFWQMRKSRRVNLLPQPLLSMYSIHSGFSQQQRTRATDRFREATSAVLLSTDVTARGMDFPGVTHVIQTDIPVDRETYIHRLGRTARAGAEGEGWLFLPGTPGKAMREKLGPLPLNVDTSLSAAAIDLTDVEQTTLPEEDDEFPSDGHRDAHVIQKFARRIDRPDDFFRRIYTATAGRFAQHHNVTEVVDMMYRFAETSLDNMVQDKSLRFLTDTRPRAMRHNSAPRWKGRGDDRAHSDRRYDGSSKNSYDRSSGGRYDRSSGDRYDRSSGSRYDRPSKGRFARSSRGGYED